MVGFYSIVSFPEITCCHIDDCFFSDVRNDFWINQTFLKSWYSSVAQGRPYYFRFCISACTAIYSSVCLLIFMSTISGYSPVRIRSSHYSPKTMRNAIVSAPLEWHKISVQFGSKDGKPTRGGFFYVWPRSLLSVHIFYRLKCIFCFDIFFCPRPAGQRAV